MQWQIRAHLCNASRGRVARGSGPHDILGVASHLVEAGARGDERRHVEQHERPCAAIELAHGHCEPMHQDRLDEPEFLSAIAHARAPRVEAAALERLVGSAAVGIAHA